MAVALNRELLDEFYRRRLAGLTKAAPFVLRITRWREMTGPVLVVKERTARTQPPAASENDVVRALRPQKIGDPDRARPYRRRGAAARAARAQIGAGPGSRPRRCSASSRTLDDGGGTAPQW